MVRTDRSDSAYADDPRVMAPYGGPHLEYRVWDGGTLHLVCSDRRREPVWYIGLPDKDKPTYATADEAIAELIGGPQLSRYADDDRVWRHPDGTYRIDHRGEEHEAQPFTDGWTVMHPGRYGAMSSGHATADDAIDALFA